MWGANNFTITKVMQLFYKSQGCIKVAKAIIKAG